MVREVVLGRSRGGDWRGGWVPAPWCGLVAGDVPSLLVVRIRVSRTRAKWWSKQGGKGKEGVENGFKKWFKCSSGG